MAKNKVRMAQKNAQKQAAKKSVRKAIKRVAKGQVIDFMRKQAGQPILKDGNEDGSLSLDSVTMIADCHGVGSCCFNRPLFVEPSDVFRIINNERAKKKFNISSTVDLYPTDEKIKPMVYFVHKELKIPFCGIRRVTVEGSEEQACPFLETTDGKMECILGEDRLTQCKADPISRIKRQSNNRRLVGWGYGVIDSVCIGCKNHDGIVKKVVVRDWLSEKGMIDRAIESDMFMNFIEWVKGKATSEHHLGIATLMLFNWHRFLIDSLGEKEAIDKSPTSFQEVLFIARAVMESAIKSEEEDKEKSE
jgi:hypothetical protein